MVALLVASKKTETKLTTRGFFVTMGESQTADAAGEPVRRQFPVSEPVSDPVRQQVRCEMLQNQICCRWFGFRISQCGYFLEVWGMPNDGNHELPMPVRCQ